MIEIYGEDGLTLVKVKKEEAVVKQEAQEVKLEGDVCLMGHAGNKNREKGKRRLEVRTAKKTFIIMISFLSCRIMFLLAIVIRKLPFFTRSGLVVHNFHEKFFALSQIAIYFTILSYLSCFFNSFTFILVTDFFKHEAKRNIESFKQVLYTKFKGSKKATQS